MMNNIHNNNNNGISQVVVCSTKMIPAVAPPPDLPTSPLFLPPTPTMGILGKTGASPGIPLYTPTMTGAKNHYQQHHRGGKGGSGSVGGGEDVLSQLPNFGRRRSLDGSQDGGAGQQVQQRSGDEGSNAISTTTSAATSSTTNVVGSAVASSAGKQESSTTSQAAFVAVGFMGRLRNLGRSSAKRPTSSGGNSITASGAPRTLSVSESTAATVVENANSSEVCASGSFFLTVNS